MLPTIAPRARSRQHPTRQQQLEAQAATQVALRGLDRARAILPPDAPLVRQAVRTPGGHRLLPRWHQDDRGWSNRNRGHHDPADAGAYSRIPVWHGRSHWLGTVVPIALADDAPRRRSHHQVPRVDPGTFRLWAEIESGYVQQQRTGRRLVVRPSTVAQVMGVSERTVQRCRAYARRLGLLVDVKPGRMLTLEESYACRRRGSRQRGLSTESALTIPRRLRLPVGCVTPTSGGSRRPRNLTFTSLTDSAAGGAAAKGAATRPPPPRRRRPAAVVQLARSTQTRIPWLRHEAIASLVPCLHKFATGDRPWTAEDLVDGIDMISMRRGYTAVRTERIRTRPAAVLAWFLRELDPINDHPRAGFTNTVTNGVNTWPTWCGHCDEHTRHRWEPRDSLTYRCHSCHPLRPTG